MEKVKQNAITVNGSTYKVHGTVVDRSSGKPAPGLQVSVYDRDLIGKDDFLGTGTTDANGAFNVSFDTSEHKELFFDRKPDLYFVVMDGASELLNTRDNTLKNADASTADINLQVDAP